MPQSWGGSRSLVRSALKALAYALVGGSIGATAGWVLGSWMAQSYQPYGPGDPRDAPVYVTMGLMMFGFPLGALLGLGFLAVRLWRARRRASPEAAL